MMEVPNLADIYVPVITGFMASLFLFGTACLQAVYYLSNYANDKLYLKLLVIVCMMLDVASTIICSRGVFFVFVDGKFPENTIKITVVPNDLMLVAVLTYAITTIVQMFYAMRVWILSKRNYFVVGCIVVLSLIQIACGILFATQFLVNPSLLQFQEPKKQASGILELVSATTCDVIITVSLVYYLHRFKSGIPSSDNLVTRLIIYSINIGLLTAVIVICNLVTWLALPGNFLFTSFHLVLSKIYINSLLVTLNSRRRNRRTLDVTHLHVPVTSFKVATIPSVVSNDTTTMQSKLADPAESHVSQGREEFLELSPIAHVTYEG